MLKMLSRNSTDRTYKIVLTSKFNKAWKRYSRSGKYKPERLYEILRLLSRDGNSDSFYRDHELKGDMAGFRECHIEHDLLLIYETLEDEVRLINFGTHSELFGN